MDEDKKPAAVDAFIDELRTDGRSKEPGEFTLDATVALKKMQDYQLVDAHHYVLELVQAAVHKGATWIDFQIDSDDMWMRFDGAPYSAAQLDTIYPAVFRKDLDAETRARAQLGLGLNAARALDLRWIRVLSGRPGKRVELHVRPDADDEVAPTDREPGKPKGRRRVSTEIHVKTTLMGERVKRIVDGLSDRLPEEQALWERCSHASVEVTLDGQRLSQGLQLEGAVGVTTFEAEGLRGVAGYRPDGDPARVRLAMHGVELSTHPLQGLHDRGFEALVEADGLRKDVSQADVVRDDRYAKVIAAVQHTRRALAKDEDVKFALREARSDAALEELQGFYPQQARDYALVSKLQIGLGVVGILTMVLGPLFKDLAGDTWPETYWVVPGLMIALALGLVVYLQVHRKNVVTRVVAELEKRFPPRSVLRYHAHRMIKSRRSPWPRGLSLRLQSSKRLD